MGLDVYGYVMAAVPYDTVVTTREEVTEVTRYNEETGAPYIKRIKETKTFVGNREVDWAKGGPQNMLEDLGLFSYAHDDNSDYAYVGKRVYEIERIDPTCEVDPTLMALRFQELKQKLESIGITDAQPQIVFGLHYSY